MCVVCAKTIDLKKEKAMHSKAEGLGLIFDFGKFDVLR